MSKRAWPLILVSLLGYGCDNGPSGKPFHYPLDTTLHFDDVQLKATHNSYHIETSDLPEWQYTMKPLDEQLDRQGVRSVELDLNYLLDDDNKGGYHFEVYHVVLADQGTTCLLFVDCLRAIAEWSHRYPGHLPIYIQMEPKSGFDKATPEQVFGDLEAAILRVFPRRRIVTPDEIRGDAPSLGAALAANRWPTLDRLRGRVMFGFDNHTDVRRDYTHGLQNLDGRLAFVDSDPGDPFAALAIRNDPVQDAAGIEAALAAHLLVRTRSDSDANQARANDPTLLVAALASGAHFISTDFPAPVEGLLYHVDIPEGSPARCNPRTAPADCTPLALEDPAFVGSAGDVAP
jgi:hypothetical protein